MAEIVVMPKLGLLMENGVVGAWRLSEGDPVAVGTIIAEIETEKITYELDSQVEGVLLKILLPEDEEAVVGAPIAVIGQPGEDLSALEALTPGGSAAPAVAETLGREGAKAPGPPANALDLRAPATSTSAEPAGRVTASPAARRLALQLGIDLTTVTGTGPGGRVTLEDVEGATAKGPAAGIGAPSTLHTAPPQAGGVLATPMARRLAAQLGVDVAQVPGSGVSGRIVAEDVVAAAATAKGTGPAAPAAAPLDGAHIAMRGGVAQEIPYAGMRRLIGEHMDTSHKLAPMVTYCGWAQVEDLKQLLARVNATRPDDDKINVTAVVVKAVALTLEKMPRFNASLDGDVVKVWRSINIGVAVALAEGLIVPVVREAGRKTLEEIAREVRDLAARARENKLLPDEVGGGTFTVTTLGGYGSVDLFNPIINQPEAAILGVGRMVETVTAVDGVPAVQATMGLSLTCDHRLLDGAPAAEFLRTLMDHLADPSSIPAWP